MSGAITFSGTSSSSQSGTRSIGPVSITGPADVGQTLAIVLASGANAINIPSGAVGVIIVPPAAITSTITWTLKTNLNSSDAGLPIPITEPTIYIFPSPMPPDQLIIDASASYSGDTDLWFW